MARHIRTLEAGTHSLQLGKRTLVMGIVNVTPDSFFDGAAHDLPEAALAHALKLEKEGADLLDIGGESTRPGSEPTTLTVELQRVEPAIRRIVTASQIPLSIDTTKPKVAALALSLGACILNDVLGLQGDPDLARVAAEYRAGVVIMHSQQGTEYKGDLVASLRSYFKRSLDIAAKVGIRENSIVLDPGIGFGKTTEQNVELMRRLGELQTLGFPILLGTSRKSFIGRILDLPPAERLEGTLATSALGVAAGADILRVHDVQANLRVARVADAIVG